MPRKPKRKPLHESVRKPLAPPTRRVRDGKKYDRKRQVVELEG